MFTHTHTHTHSLSHTYTDTRAHIYASHTQRRSTRADRARGAGDVCVELGWIKSSTSGCVFQINPHLANPSELDSWLRVVQLFWRLAASSAVFFSISLASLTCERKQINFSTACEFYFLFSLINMYFPFSLFFLVFLSFFPFFFFSFTKYGLLELNVMFLQGLIRHSAV